MFASLSHSAVFDLAAYAVGAALFALLLLLVLRRGDGRGSRWRETMRGLMLPASIAALGLVGCLAGAASVLTGALASIYAAISTAVFALLAAAVVHAALHRRASQREWLPLIILCSAYLAALAASALWISAAADGQAASLTAVRVLAFCFFLIAAPLLITVRRETRSDVPISAIVLAIGSAVLPLLALAGDRPALQALGRHLPMFIAVTLVYSDFRFALADRFLKPALSLAGYVAVAAGVFALVESMIGGVDGATAGLAVATSAVVTAVCARYIARAAAGVVDRFFLRRYDYEAIHARITAVAERCHGIPELLESVARELAPALAATRVHVEIADTLSDDLGGAIATIALPTMEAPRFRYSIGQLAAGRALSERDSRFLHSVALLVGGRIDAIRAQSERQKAAARIAELQRRLDAAEARAAAPTVATDFIVDALATLSDMVKSAPERAEHLIANIAVVLRAGQELDSRVVTFEAELQLLRAYLRVEHTRLGERLRVVVDIPHALRGLRVPALLLQPLVATAIEYGVKPNATGGEIHVGALYDPELRCLRVMIRDSGDGFSSSTQRRGALQAVEERMARLYESGASLLVVTEPGSGTTVSIELPMSDAAQHFSTSFASSAQLKRSCGD